MVSDSVARYLSLGFHSQTVLRTKQANLGTEKEAMRLQSCAQFPDPPVMKLQCSAVFPTPSLTNKQAVSLQEMQRTLHLP